MMGYLQKSEVKQPSPALILKTFSLVAGKALDQPHVQAGLNRPGHTAERLFPVHGFQRAVSQDACHQFFDPPEPPSQMEVLALTPADILPHRIPAPAQPHS